MKLIDAALTFFVTSSILTCPVVSNEGSAMVENNEKIEIKLGKIKYSIPREYVREPFGHSGIVLHVKYPGFGPVDNENCPQFPHAEDTKCRSIRLWVSIDYGLGTEDGFENQKNHFFDKSPKKGPYGFDLYFQGPEEARQNWYTKKVNDFFLVFRCDFDKDQKNALCSANSSTRTGLSLSYNFPIDKLNEAEDVDIGLRNLLDSFADGGIDD
jgi:hypothetical protein